MTFAARRATIARSGVKRDEAKTKIRKVRCVDPAGNLFVKGMIYTLVETPGRVSLYTDCKGPAKPGALNMLGSWSKEGYDMYHKNRFAEMDESRNVVLEKFHKMEKKWKEAEAWIDDFLAI